MTWWRRRIYGTSVKPYQAGNGHDQEAEDAITEARLAQQTVKQRTFESEQTVVRAKEDSGRILDIARRLATGNILGDPIGDRIREPDQQGAD